MFLAKTPRIVVFGLSTFVALCCLAPDGLASEPLPSAKAPAKIKAWHLLLESSANGKYDFLLAPQGVRLSNKSFDITLVAKAPQWRFYAIRESAKEIASCTLAQFKTMVVPSFTMAGITQELKTPSQTVSFVDKDKLPAFRYIFAIKGTSELFWQSGKRERATINAVEIESVKFPLDQAVEPAISRFLNLPSLPGVPCQVVTVTGRQRGWQLRTTGKLQTEVAPQVFDPPQSGYRNVGTIDRSFLGKSAMTGFDGLTDLLDVEKEDSKPKHVRQPR